MLAAFTVVVMLLFWSPWRNSGLPAPKGKIRLVNPNPGPKAQEKTLPPATGRPRAGTLGGYFKLPTQPDYTDVDAKIAELGYDGSEDPDYARVWLAGQYISGVSGSALQPGKMKALGWTESQIEAVQKLMMEVLKEIKEQETAHRVLIEQTPDKLVFDVLPFAEETGINARFWKAVEDVLGPREKHLFSAYAMDFLNLARGFGTLHWRYRVSTPYNGFEIRYSTVDKQGREHDVGTTSGVGTPHKYSHLARLEDVAGVKSRIPSNVPEKPTPLK